MLALPHHVIEHVSMTNFEEEKNLSFLFPFPFISFFHSSPISFPTPVTARRAEETMEDIASGVASLTPSTQEAWPGWHARSTVRLAAVCRGAAPRRGSLGDRRSGGSGPECDKAPA